MADVELEQVAKTFPNGYCALDGFDLHVRDGEFLVLVGPSGCGKSTVLNLIAGLEQCTQGEIRIGERPVTDEPSKRRDVAMVFQDYALYPHMTVARNIGFPLELAKTPKSEIAQKVGEVARILGLEAQLGKRPGQLSGGQKQRVAMGRAIVRQPSVYLMDEPLSNLDAKLRVQMRSEIARLQHELGVTTIYVTHDQVEAMTMGDRVAVMLDGRLQQLDTPRAIYAHPANLFVAGFIGSPPMNLVVGSVVPGDGGHDALAVDVGGARLPLSRALLARCRPLADLGDVAVGFRPEHVRLCGSDTPGLAGTVSVVEALGAEILVHVDVDVTRVDIAASVSDERAREELGAELAATAATTIVARLDPDTPIDKGDSVRLAVDPDRLHLFDPVSGASLIDG